MRRRGLLAIIGVVAAGVLLASAGAGVAMQLDRGDSSASAIRAVAIDQDRIDKAVQRAKANLKGRQLLRLLKSGNRPALLRYLKKHYGMDPRRVAIQKGAKNYAGPNCPGAPWHCTRARQVVQYSSHSDDDDDDDDDDDHDDDINYNTSNRFSCSNSYPGTGVKDSTPPAVACVVVQIRTSGNNFATCIERTNQSPIVAGLWSVSQLCDITQVTGTGNNFALIDQEVSRRDTGTEQEVLQEALLQQTAVNGSNAASIDQDANLLIVGSSSAGQEQDVHQLADAEMDTEVGHNGLNVDQNQNLIENATGFVARQLQNADNDPQVNCSPEEPAAPNSCADIDMSTNTGHNLLDLDQVNDLEMTVRSGPVTGFEQQGSCEGGLLETTLSPAPATGCAAGVGADGGTEASIDMFSFEEGSTTSDMNGRALQNMPTNKPGIVQLQFADPGCCFGTFFVGDPANSDIDLLADQTARSSAYQAGENTVECISGNPDGGQAECDATMTVANNNGTSTFSGTGQALFANQDCRSTSACPATGVITGTTATFPTTTTG
jgi:hypothetical protein